MLSNPKSKCNKKWRPKSVQRALVFKNIPSIGHYSLYLWIVQCMPDVLCLSLIYREKCTLTSSTGRCCISLSDRKMLSSAISNDLSKNFQENVGWPTEVRIGLGFFRKSKIFRLLLTPLVRTLLWVRPSHRKPATEQSDPTCQWCWAPPRCISFAWLLFDNRRREMMSPYQPPEIAAHIASAGPVSYPAARRRLGPAGRGPMPFPALL